MGDFNWKPSSFYIISASCAPLAPLEEGLDLLEELERALLGNIAQLAEAHDRLLARRVLLLAHDAPLLRLHQVLLLQTAGRVLGSSVENLRRAAHRDHAAVLLAIPASNIPRHLIFIRENLFNKSPYTSTASLFTHIHLLIISF